MRIRIRHEVRHGLEFSQRHATATIRLTPRNHVGQHLLRWSLDVLSDSRLYPQEDAFGNLSHTFSLEGPMDDFTVIAEGEVETQDTSGIVRGAVERFPTSFFLRQTALTEPDAAIARLAGEVEALADDDLGRMHALMGVIHERVAEIPQAEGAVAAAAVLAAEEGVSSASLAHLFASAARHLRIPARQVSGYVVEEDEAGSAYREWVEGYAPKIGWVAFDCGRCLCTTEAYVRLAVGFDTLGVAPVRALGTLRQSSALARDVFAGPKGGAGQGQSQSQSQS